MHPLAKTQALEHSGFAESAREGSGCGRGTGGGDAARQQLLFRLAHRCHALTGLNDLLFSAINAKSPVNHDEAECCPATTSRGRPPRRAKNYRARQQDIRGNGSPKILLTASRERFERSVTTTIGCDEDHILCEDCRSLSRNLFDRAGVCGKRASDRHGARSASRRVKASEPKSLRSPSWIAGR